MVERWILVGFMIWRIQIVWIYGINMGKQAKYKLNTGSYKLLVFLNFWFTKISKKFVAGTHVFWTYTHTIYVLYVFDDQKDYVGRI